MPADVSWRPANGPRQFGKFICWDGDVAVVRRYSRKYRISKKDLTFEVR